MKQIFYDNSIVLNVFGTPLAFGQSVGQLLLRSNSKKKTIDNDYHYRILLSC